ncbi:DUF4242 domain-containing protein [Spiractinospora alimapuensis]|uniref:DUF4242 domain-containing protein n=1 Tax=Spiractinospora alimapuensis TaxID=2820884 RepID=UPI001F29D937|nr:DUF4242 domain-containing protein [Spiractinospora alimapuensis]QVQ50011.1 DUF4242 domain-containing protein [Spiractinospora alimapuensis]
MALQLIELTPDRADRAAADALIESAAKALSAGNAELVEAQVPSDFGRVFLIAEERADSAAADALNTASITFDDIAEVRLVGADLETVKASKGSAQYLVEWDLPEGLSMDKYLARKAEKSPLYENVPETQFLRTYVREDMGKCLCFYDAPDTEAVERARQVVDTPIDRLHELSQRD